MQGFLAAVVLLGCLALNMAQSAKDNLLIITVATDQTDGFKQFIRSTKKFGLSVKVLGMGEEWRGGDVKRFPGGGHKVNLLKKELDKYKNDETLLVMFVDSYDVVFTDGAEVIKDRFSKFDARIVFSAEDFCWPDASLKNKYPPVKASEKRFLNSGGFIGYAKDLEELVNYSLLSNDGDDQGYYTAIFLDRSLRNKWNIKLDTRSEIFQNLNGALGDISLKFKGTHSYLYNIATGTTPIVIHGNGPIKVEFNRLANYLADGWTSSAGCLSCKEETISLKDVKAEDYPTVLMALFVEQATPFIREFFKRISELHYPKNKIDLFIHNKMEYHNLDVKKFVDEFGTRYQSVSQVFSSDAVQESMARNWAL